MMVNSSPLLLVDAQIQTHPVCDHSIHRRRDCGFGVGDHGWAILGLHRMLPSGIVLEGIGAWLDATPAQGDQARPTGYGAAAHQGWR